MRNGTVVSSRTTEDLLTGKDIASWTGSRKSLPVLFSENADSIRIDAVVKAVGIISDTDISPGYFIRIHSPLNVGRSGNVTFDYGNGRSKVNFDYELIKW